eukprot:CAMPEP_0172561314 /NCGR_PEP_ID=MMETSP1067-20121228/92400_1 /TAXON_ID=265564 ORGANISM="Thalassiosira punctigera, Strain Tpunct2005C2" /NCGR_SAMPLE_ID=MMETSP1067 /ASSEMBLY_ACC=CAM_ASM_000444 /LENGTH=41 /DNA_ID= /DNA_START= /DNA_END= /DNA_ORIENTATION=
MSNISGEEGVERNGEANGGGSMETLVEMGHAEVEEWLLQLG